MTDKKPASLKSPEQLAGSSIEESPFLPQLFAASVNVVMDFLGGKSFYELPKPWKLTHLLDEFPEPSPSLQEEMFQVKGNNYTTTPPLPPAATFFLPSLLQCFLRE